MTARLDGFDLRSASVRLVERIVSPMLKALMWPLCTAYRLRVAGAKLHRAGFTLLATDAYRTALERDPSDSVLQRDYASLLWAQGDYTEAARNYEQLLSVRGGDPILLSNYGKLLLKESPDKAEALLLRAAASDKADAALLKALAQAQYDSGHPESAWETCERFLTSFGDDVDVLVVLGRMACMNGHFEDALEWFNRAIRVNGRSTDAMLGAAGALCELGRFDDARSLLGKLSSLESHDGATELEIGRCLSLIGDVSSAIPHVERAVRLQQGDPESISLLASLYSRAGRLKEAFSAATQVLGTGAEESGTYDLLGYVCIERRDYQEAERILRKGLKQYPGNRDICARLGLALAAEERYREALDILRLCRGEPGDDPEIMELIAYCTRAQEESLSQE